ncbi:MAG: hypothetical protein JWO46_1703 [Nocardioidaceae bacterium]|nr:hypothetical protein [Nocardioidaceae bacterium]
MNETIELGRPDVVAFVAKVRAHLTDLPDEEQQELTEGLAADLGDLVAERGPDVLGDPAAYARELRQAAGLEAGRKTGGFPRDLLPDVTWMLDRAHAEWDELLEATPWRPAGFLEAMRPAWWVARAWLAVELLDQMFGSWPYSWIPSMFGVLGILVTLAAIVVSVQIGRGKLWPAPITAGVWRRVLLLGLNLFAVVVLVPTVSQLPTGANLQDAAADSGYSSGTLSYKGSEVQNIYPYDAQGNPLVGVQLVDEQGRRLAVAPYEEGVVPWTNGRTKLFSVFPLPTRALDKETGEYTGTPTVSPPLASLPPVSLAGIVASTFAGVPTPVPSGGDLGAH